MSLTLAAVGTGIEVIKKASDEMAVVEKLKAWIIVQPKEAAGELAKIIEEVLKAPRVVNSAANILLEQIDSGKPKLKDLAVIGNGTPQLDVEQLRPHCHEIGRIASRYLWQWLEQPGIRGANSNELREALEKLSSGDAVFFEGLANFAEVINDIAQKTFDLKASGQDAEALALLGQVAPALFEAQIRANEFAKMLLTMQIDFQRRALG